MLRWICTLVFLVFAVPAWGATTTYTINWTDTTSGESEWQVERRAMPSGGYTALGTTAQNVLIYSDPTAVVGTSYRYRVRALVGGVSQPYSNEACVPTACGAFPTFPHGTGTLAGEPMRLVAGVLGAATSDSKVYFAASCSQANVSTAFSGVSAEGIVAVPAGSCLWNSGLSITKGVRLRGSGVSTTTITSSGADPIIRILPTNQSLNPEFEITGFTFNTANRAKAITLGMDSYVVTTLQTKANIHHNAFLGTTSVNSNYQYIFIQGIGGVVWKNTFAGMDQQVRSLGTDGDGLFALVPVHLGSANAMYFEDNIFTIDAPDDYYFADCQYTSIKRVWRYNTFTTNAAMSGSGFIDVHGPTNSGMLSCMGDEIYGNKVVSTNNKSLTWIQSRGGKNMVFYNDVATSGGVAGARYFGERFSWCPPTYCSTHQCMRTYTWNNRRNTTTNVDDAYSACGPGECGFTCDGTSNYPEKDMQVFDYKTSFTGSSGVGCGVSLPAPTSYADRVGYWVTTQSCSSVAGLVGDITTNPARGTIMGAFYTVQSGVWVAYYTPYAYPHPLRQGN